MDTTRLRFLIGGRRPLRRSQGDQAFLVIVPTEGHLMVIGPVEAVRVFTKNLAESRRFYAEVLGLKELVSNDRWAIFDTGQAKLLIERIDDGDAEGDSEVGRFAHFSFTVADMEKALQSLRGAPINWLGPPERQDWGGILAYLKDPDGTVLTLVQYPTPRRT